MAAMGTAVVATFPLETQVDSASMNVPYAQPHEVGTFWTDTIQTVYGGHDGLRHLLPPNQWSWRHSSLLSGWKRSPPKANMDSSVSYILSALRHANRKLVPGETVTFRHNITKILVAPYNKRDEWRIEVNRKRGILFFDIRMTEEERRRFEETRNDRFTYVGYCFEHLATGGSAETPANPNVSFTSVVRTAIGSHGLVIGAEIDCLRAHAPPHPDLSDYVELKTSRVLDNPHIQESFNRNKLLNYWAQSFSVGVPRIVCGFRGDDLTLQAMQELGTLEIAQQIHPKYWNPRRCLAFLYDVIHGLWETTEEDGRYSMCFKRPFNAVVLTRSPDEKAFVEGEWLEGV